MTEKKSTYNAAAQKKYNEKRKKLGATVTNDEYEKITEHMHAKGFTSVNSYLRRLIREDMEHQSRQAFPLAFCIISFVLILQMQYLIYPTACRMLIVRQMLDIWFCF